MLLISTIINNTQANSFVNKAIFVRMICDAHVNLLSIAEQPLVLIFLTMVNYFYVLILYQAIFLIHFTVLVPNLISFFHLTFRYPCLASLLY